MKTITTTLVLLLISICSMAQTKQTFDAVTYTVPKGWQKTQNEGGVQLAVSDKKTGGYAIAIITKTIAATGNDAADNFTADWNKLVKGSVQVNDEPAMQQPVDDNGWQIVSGTANYTDGAQQGLATLLTATGGGQMVSVVLMTNTNVYQEAMLIFLNSLQLANAASNNSTTNAGTTSVAGMWVFYNTESNGMYNGFPQLTGGYMRREYVFYKDGTYLFRAKDWMVYVKDILFVYETGTYSVNGNQITLTPQKGKGEWWSKITNNTSKWGKLVRASTDYKSEKTSYSFEIYDYEGSGRTLLLKTANPTSRDGKNGDNAAVQEYRYTARDLKNTLIDNPPGFKTGFENKSLTAASNETTNNTAKVAKNQSALAGTIWQGSWYEKFAATGSVAPYTGGFSTMQYKFNADGTYRFVDVAASYYTTTKTLAYETGTYTVNGNQLTISPANGAKEEWSFAGKVSNGNSGDRNGAILRTWNKKIKNLPRQLEKYTYTFTIGKNGDSNALILTHHTPTVREGDISPNYINEAKAATLIQLPKGF